MNNIYTYSCSWICASKGTYCLHPQSDTLHNDLCSSRDDSASIFLDSQPRLNATSTNRLARTPSFCSTCEWSVQNYELYHGQYHRLRGKTILPLKSWVAGSGQRDFYRTDASQQNGNRRQLWYPFDQERKQYANLSCANPVL